MNHNILQINPQAGLDAQQSLNQADVQFLGE
jgi:hypothetical protein